MYTVQIEQFSRLTEINFSKYFVYLFLRQYNLCSSREEGVQRLMFLNRPCDKEDKKKTDWGYVYFRGKSLLNYWVVGYIQENNIRHKNKN